MAKHHPDLIFCRKQPGVGKTFTKEVQYNTQSCVCCVLNENPKNKSDHSIVVGLLGGTEAWENSSLSTH